MKLSDVAQREKRNLILVSAVAICISGYDLKFTRLNALIMTVEDIPPSLPTVVLLAAVAYFLGAYSFYYWVDNAAERRTDTEEALELMEAPAKEWLEGTRHEMPAGRDAVRRTFVRDPNVLARARDATKSAAEIHKRAVFFQQRFDHVFS